MRLWLRGSPQNLWRVRQPGVEIVSDTCSGHIPQKFDLVSLHRTIPLRLFRTVPAVRSAAFERIDDAECAGVIKVDLDDIGGVKWCAQGLPQDMHGRVCRWWWKEQLPSSHDGGGEVLGPGGQAELCGRYKGSTTRRN